MMVLLDLKDPLAVMVRLVPPDTMVAPASRVPLGLKDLLELTVRQGYQVLMGFKVPLALRVLLELTDCLVPPAFRVLLDLMEPLDHKDRQVLRGFKVPLDHKDLLDLD
jgi:hypothetical protein